MKKSEAKPGTKVLASTAYDEWGDGEHLGPYYYDEYDDTTLVGVIRSKPASEGCVWVKWIDGDFANEEEEVEISLLTLESERESIEKEFSALSKEIQGKMKEAAKLVKEANALAKKAHAKSLADMYDAVSPLINAMDNSGWRSSSWGC